MNDSKNFNNDFLNNEIYQHLTSRNATSLVSIIDTTYRNCEYILGMIPKEFSNYTLHDIHHSIRVINYMTQFVKKDLDKYSDFHLALILIVGLLHDTGMLVSDEEKKQIISNEIKADSCPEIIQDQFQTYIRDRHSQRVVKTLSTYVIDKDSGAVFSSIFRLETYNFTDDILLICQSHTESIDWIRTNISESAELTHYEYNPQQIAMLLKIADNLDIDDRRAPYSLLNSLKIKGYSETEWLKHIPISNYEKVIFKNGAFIIKFKGKCEDPFIFRKVMDHISWLNKTCSEINNITSNYIEPYQFQINDKFSIDIKTKGFEAINLNFAIDYTSVLDLLMGENLYGKRSAGLRELIQNSIDAVMVMREKTSSKPLSSYKPSICIEMNRANNSIIVHDNGIGMDMHVLNNYFFNVGKSYYTSKEYLEEHLKYSAIGHFGIGFLACFMLSKKVLLETKSIKSDPITLEFEDKSSCVTKISNNECIFEEGHGTRIHLTYNDVIPSVFENEDALINYVTKISVCF